MRIKEQERDRKWGRQNVTESHKKQAVTESFSHTVLWPRSASKIKEEDYTLAERLGRILSLLWLSATSTKSPLTMELSGVRAIDQKHTSTFGTHAVVRSFRCPKSEIFYRMGRLAVLGGLTKHESTGKWQNWSNCAAQWCCALVTVFWWEKDSPVATDSRFDAIQESRCESAPNRPGRQTSGKTICLCQEHKKIRICFN